MTDDLRSRLAGALEKFCWMEFASTGEVITCISRDDAVNAAVALLETAIREATARDCCGTARHTPHVMACRQYAGPVGHWRVYGSDTVLESAAYGLVECTCGMRFSALLDGCPNYAETWRGPEPPAGAP